MSHLHYHNNFTAPADYTGINIDTALTVGVGLPGQTRFCEDIAIIDDVLAEGPEEFTYNLLSLNNALVSINPSRSSATVRILDDDGTKHALFYNTE